jgi:hypothetical protein
VGQKISAHADGGPRSRVCARDTLNAAPHRHEWKFSGPRVCRITFKHLTQTPQKSYAKFRNHRKPFEIFKKTLTDLLLIFSKKKLKIAPNGARGWGSNFIFSLQNFYYFFRGPCKNLKPYANPFGVLNNGIKKKKKKWNNYQK